jgi:nucleotide-binding universal stress UspA family protein
MTATPDAPLVLAVNDSDSDRLAIDWAATEAAVRHRELRVVSAYQRLLPAAMGSLSSQAPPAPDHSAGAALDAVVAAAAARVTALQPTVTVTGAVVEGPAASVLLDESTRASLLVLGSRQRAIIGSILGSVSAAVAARASCPVVVLRGPSGLEAESPSVVVGLDVGDDAAAAALLSFGFDAASRHRAELRVVACWHPDPLATLGYRLQAPPPAHVDEWLAAVTGGWREKYPDVATHLMAISDHPTAGLVAESLSQRLLVVGSRGRRALAGTLLGSVSQGVLHHAMCPVAVVPTHRD